MPAETQTKSSQKIVKQTIKQTKQKILTAKTPEAFTRKTKFDPLKYPYFKNMFKAKFCFENCTVFYLQDLKTIHWPLKID